MIPDMIRISLAHYTTHLRAAGRSPGTISLRVRHAKRMLTYVGKPPAMVALGDIEEWIAGHDWAASTHRSVVASMRLYFGWLGTDTADGLKSPPEPRPCPKPTPPDVLDHALAHSSGKLHLLVGWRRARGCAEPNWRAFTPTRSSVPVTDGGSGSSARDARNDAWRYRRISRCS